MKPDSVCTTMYQILKYKSLSDVDACSQDDVHICVVFGQVYQPACLLRSESKYNAEMWTYMQNSNLSMCMWMLTMKRQHKLSFDFARETSKKGPVVQNQRNC